MLLSALYLCACKGDAPPAPAPSSTFAEQPEPSPARAPRKPLEDFAVFGVDNTGLVRVSDGKATTLVAHRYPIKDIVINASGVVYATAIGGSWMIDGDTVTELPKPDSVPDYDHLALAPDGALWALNHGGAHRWDGTAWSTTPGSTFGNALLYDIAVDATNRVWVATPDVLWRRDGTTWAKVDGAFAKTKQPYFRALAVGSAGEVYASSLPGLFVHEADAWRKLPFQGSYGAIDEVVTSADGRLAVSGGVGDVAVRSPAGAISTIALRKAGVQVDQADAMAIDASGRTWLRTDNGVVIVDAGGKVLQHWALGTVDGITGKITALAVFGKGPALPTLTTAARGTVVGKVVSKGKPVANATIELCNSPASLMFDGTPCSKAAIARTGKTSTDGTFSIADVPVGSYGFAVKPKSTWFVTWGTGEQCCESMESGQTYDIGSLTLDKLE